jgi:hypothetical protein
MLFLDATLSGAQVPNQPVPTPVRLMSQTGKVPTVPWLPLARTTRLENYPRPQAGQRSVVSRTLPTCLLADTLSTIPPSPSPAVPLLVPSPVTTMPLSVRRSVKPSASVVPVSRTTRRYFQEHVLWHALVTASNFVEMSLPTASTTPLPEHLPSTPLFPTTPIPHTLDVILPPVALRSRPRSPSSTTMPL